MKRFTIIHVTEQNNVVPGEDELSIIVVYHKEESKKEN